MCVCVFLLFGKLWVLEEDSFSFEESGFFCSLARIHGNGCCGIGSIGGGAAGGDIFFVGGSRT